MLENIFIVNLLIISVLPPPSKIEVNFPSFNKCLFWAKIQKSFEFQPFSTGLFYKNNFPQSRGRGRAGAIFWL